MAKDFIVQWYLCTFVVTYFKIGMKRVRRSISIFRSFLQISSLFGFGTLANVSLCMFFILYRSKCLERTRILWFPPAGFVTNLNLNGFFVKQQVIFFIRFLAVRLNNDLKGHRGLWNEAEQKIEAQEKKQEPSSYTSMLAHS